MGKILSLDSVDLYNRLYGLETLNPLVSVIDSNKATSSVDLIRFNCGIYTLYPRLEKACDIRYGRQTYDYQEGAIVCFAPGQTAETDPITDKVQIDTHGTLFHPNLLRRTSLGKNIEKYMFSSYEVNKALRSSEEERSIVMDYLKIIRMELEHGMDKHSKALLVNHIELLLNYCMCFYERQFTTRDETNRDVLTRFENLLDEYFESTLAEQDGLPAVECFTDRLCLSSSCFGDIFKKKTGKSPQGYIQEKIIELAKGRISGTTDTVSQIAYSPGFQYPQHFCQLSKKRVGYTPSGYRAQIGLSTNLQKTFKRTLDIKTVYKCNRYLGCKTLHPQVNLINLENPNLGQEAVKFGFCAILLIEGYPDSCYCCGYKYCDYPNATMVFLTPGEIFRMSGNNTLLGKGYLLVSHPDLLFHTSLDNPIKNYTLFTYHEEGALHLSRRETVKVTCCLGNIEDELHHAIDTRSGTILSRHIELLLDYCTRYYERQLITREDKNRTVLEKLERLLDEYIISGKLENGQLPTAEYCTAELDLSVAYFNDLLRFETDRTLEECFQFKRLNVARTMLLKNDNTPALVAQQLDYPNVQYSNLISEKVTDIAPYEYLYAQN